ncbi:FUSC family protein [Alicyclobacillus macrosporangiidus]|uniref:Aromatic acid exporter family member 1 n=1 Tax=Alicyclobacillus macrosporangiidus TaxID=392015 RepID=A0A1I7F274_9BACL|nr:aromatic acid exporter family protein [Alicyclobacillus macrosporangiidus]SFU30343.1 Aromatic acid exporter family member 1 [Alicyclobacillus macrosporangiidus]
MSAFGSRIHSAALSRLRPLLPAVGPRTVKTCLAIALSIATARALHLMSPQFAGVVAVLAVQPSVHRSLRQGVRQWLSAGLGAAVGMGAILALGRPAWWIGLIVLLVLGWHVRWRWTQSLLIAVVIVINTMGADGMSSVASGLNQLALVTIGMGYGTLANVLIRPSHTGTVRYLIDQCEAGLTTLWQILRRDVDRGMMTAYPDFRARIDDVRQRIQEGFRFAAYVAEDQRYDPRTAVDPTVHPTAIFSALESALERTRDVHRSLQPLSGYRMHPDLYRALRLCQRALAHVIAGRPCHAGLADPAFRRAELSLMQLPATPAPSDLRRHMAQYQVLQHLRQFYAALALCAQARQASRPAPDAEPLDFAERIRQLVS